MLVRDRAGVKPLYFYHQHGRFIFASEIKSILPHPAVTPEVDEESLYHYLTFLTAPAPRTLFRHIKKLPAGHFLVVSRDGTIKIERYWDPLPPETLEVQSMEEHKEEILRLLRASIKKRMMSDVPFGVFLSGGVDSSANVALMSEVMSRPVETFTVGFSDAEAN
jgi:asparagine synthase (glutamine-hydrolysing)